MRAREKEEEQWSTSLKNTFLSETTKCKQTYKVALTVLATTNNQKYLDEALLDRLRIQICLDKGDLGLQSDILKHWLSHFKIRWELSESQMENLKKLAQGRDK
jgi:SpoVK/Ycf46/Vps4 family AAA+-type ATPase